MRHLAIDIGAESGRGVVGWREGDRLRMIEIHRFANKPISENGGLFWDINHLVYEAWSCLQMAGSNLASVGIDTWAVDHVLVDEHGQMVAPPRHYRDPRTNGVMESAWEKVDRRRIYEYTGIQMLPFNSLYQLLATDPEVLAKTACFLTIPDFLHLKLMGEGKATCEFTNATTTQLFDPRIGDWSDELISAFGLPRQMFPEVIAPGTMLGAVEHSDIKVIAPATHDTGSAVAGVPFESKKAAWISSGTWSILGMEVDAPVINDASYAANFTNEGGVNQTFRLSKNVAGLWIVQQCRAAWGAVDTYEDLMNMAADAPDTGERIDPDDPKFFAPGDMPARVSAFSDKGHVIRVVLSSLADRYAQVLATAEQLSNQMVEKVHIVGGGCQNRLLNQLTANACQKSVVAGPVESTALGNLAVQMIATGEIESLAEARALIANSYPLETYTPCP